MNLECRDVLKLHALALDDQDGLAENEVLNLDEGSDDAGECLAVVTHEFLEGGKGDFRV
jgi:hypothetical protein